MVVLHGIANVSEHEVGQQLQELVLVHCVHEEVRSSHLVQRLGEHFWKVVVRHPLPMLHPLLCPWQAAAVWLATANLSTAARVVAAEVHAAKDGDGKLE